MLEDYLKLGIRRDKIHVSVNPCLSTWCISRDCLVGDAIDGPPRAEILPTDDGNYEVSYENNRPIILSIYTTIDVELVNRNKGIIISSSPMESGYYRYAYIPVV